MNWVGVLFVVLSIGQDVLCKTKCSVTFYWTEKGQDRVDKMRNYGLLEEKLEKRFYKELKGYFNPKNVYAYTVEGDCCWKIYGEEKYEGQFHKIRYGFSGIPNYPQFNVNSMKKTKC